MTDLTNRWVVLALLFVVGVSAPMQLQCVAALASFLIADAGLTYTDIGLMTGLFMFPGIFLAAPSGMLSAWLGDRMTLIIGIALMGISSIVFAITDSYAVMIASRLVGGAGGVVAAVLLPKVVNDWFSGREIATSMSIIASSVGFGIGFAMAVLPMIAEASSWRVAMLANAGTAVLAIVLLLLIYQDKVPAAAAPQTGGLLWRIEPPELVLASLAGIGRGLFSAAYSVFMSFLPALLIARGMAPVEAGVLTSVSAIVSLVSVPLGGYLSDRTGKPNQFIVGGSLSTALVCIALPFFALPLLWVVLFGALRGGCTGGLMALPSRVLSPQSRSTGFAVVSATYFICVALLPTIAGYLLDATGSTAAPLLFAGLLWFLISVLLGLFLYLERRWVRPVRGQP